MMMMMMMIVTKAMFVTRKHERALLHQCLKKIWKSGTSSNTSEVCVLFVKTGIWNKQKKVEGFILYVTYSVSERDKKQNLFFLRKKNKHWKNLLVLIMWKKKKKNRKIPLSGVAVHTFLSHASLDFSVLLCNRHPSILTLRVNSELFIVCYYIMNISLPLENKTGV